MSLKREPGKQSHRTICEVHREMYQLVAGKPPRDIYEAAQRRDVLKLLKEAFGMGKKMTNKLRQYSKGYDAGWWKLNRLAGGEIDEPQPELED